MDLDQFDSFVEDLLGEKLERPLVIVGASKIDDLLYNILLKILIEPTKNDDDLLKGDNPISTFSSRIKLVHRLGIIDESLFQVLERVRKIRNLCAHSIEFDVKKAPVKDHLNELKKNVSTRNSFDLTKTRFFPNSFNPTEELQCIFITICVILEAIHDAVAKIKLNPITIKISGK